MSQQGHFGCSGTHNKTRHPRHPREDGLVDPVNVLGQTTQQSQPVLTQRTRWSNSRAKRSTFDWYPSVGPARALAPEAPKTGRRSADSGSRVPGLSVAVRRAQKPEAHEADSSGQDSGSRVGRGANKHSRQMAGGGRRPPLGVGVAYRPAHQSANPNREMEFEVSYPGCASPRV